MIKKIFKIYVMLLFILIIKNPCVNASTSLSFSGETYATETVLIFENSSEDYTVSEYKLYYGSYCSGTNYFTWFLIDEDNDIYNYNYIANYALPFLSDGVFEDYNKVLYVFENNSCWCELNKQETGFELLNILNDNTQIYASSQINDLINNFERVTTYNGTGIYNYLEYANLIDNSFYFENQHNNFPDNVSCECTYVSSAQLLSYYDIFYDNDIIADSGNSGTSNFIQSVELENCYDVSICDDSPGATNAYKNNLISIANQGGNALTVQQTNTMINNALSSTNHSSTADYNYVTSAVSILNLEKPIIMLLESFEYEIENNTDVYSSAVINSPHAFIVYGYVINEGLTYYVGHLGWKDTNGLCFTKAIVKPLSTIINININISGNNINSNTSAYIFKHNDSCLGFGLNVYNNLYSNYLVYNSQNHRYACPTCSSILITLSHTYNYSYLWKNYTQHKAFCICGEMKYEPHAISRSSLQSNSSYSKCLLCGGLANSGFINYSINDGIYSSDNGSFQIGDGPIVLSDDDIELYLSGELVLKRISEYDEFLESEEILVFIEDKEKYDII